MFTEYDKFVEFFSYSLSNSLILLIIFIIFGRLFIVNWKNKKEGWQTKAWINGIITLISFLILAFLATQLNIRNVKFFVLFYS